MERVDTKKVVPSSSTAKTAQGFGIAGTAIAGLAGLGVLGGGNNVLGAQRFAPGYAPGYMPGFVGAVPVSGECGCYVTEKEMGLIRESTGKDSIIARLEAEKYADAAIRNEVDPLKNRICALETAAAVNAARDADYRCYVEREFIHQPKASIRESIVVCKQCGCHCGCDCATTPTVPSI